MRINLILLTLTILGLSLTNVSAQQEAAAAKSPKIIAGGVVNGKAQSLPKPVYPPAALAVRASGAVNVQITIDEQGNVISASAVSGHPLLRSAAVEAAKQAKFSPTLLSGQPVKVTGVIVYNFVAPVEQKNYQERLKIMALGVVLSLARADEFAKDDALTDEVPAEFPEFAGELEPLKTLKNLTPADREQILNKVYDAVKMRVGGATAAEMEIGKLFGDVLFEAGKGKADQNYQVSEQKLKDDLSKIKSLLASIEDSFPKEVLDQFVMLTELSTKPNLTSEDNLTTLVYRMMRIMETVSPDTFK